MNPTSNPLKIKVNKTKLLKVVYFDENSAIDSLEIIQEGSVNKVNISEKKKKAGGNIKAGVSAGKGIVFDILAQLLPVKASAEAGLNLEMSGQSIIKQTISNTILSEYYRYAENQKNDLEIIEGYNITIPQTSLSFIKTILPIINLMKKEYIEKEFGDVPIDFTKLEEFTDDLKGYYTVKAKNDKGDIKILRFNIKAFRNNYKLSDLGIMKLKFYAVKIGEISTKDDNLNFINELIPNKEITESDLRNSIHQDKIEIDQCYDLFDVVLAGVVNN